MLLPGRVEAVKTPTVLNDSAVTSLGVTSSSTPRLTASERGSVASTCRQQHGKEEGRSVKKRVAQ